MPTRAIRYCINGYAASDVISQDYVLSHTREHSISERRDFVKCVCSRHIESEGTTVTTVDNIEHHKQRQ